MNDTGTNLSPRSLVEGLPDPPYFFAEHVLDARQPAVERARPGTWRTFLVIAGEVTLSYLDAHGTTLTRRCGRLEGWHAPPGATFTFVTEPAPGTRGADGPEQAVVLEAGALPDAAGMPSGGPVQPCLPLSDYTVDKPWGHEVWYAENLPGARYAVKQIHMTAGHQSSLQSHRFKTETNYVVEGAATVINGEPAPADVSTRIDVDALPRRVYHARTGWSSAPDVIHRVIAHVDYTSVEISTPELDDVIRWADDSGRSNGRVAAEHARAAQHGIADQVRMYLDEQSRVLAAFPVDEVVAAAEALFDTYERGGTVYAVGNGGNAGTLDHAYCDFTHHPFVSEDKHAALGPAVKRLRFVNLCGSPAELTGTVNDLGADQMYAGSLEPFVTAGDLVMAYSGSGNSANVVRALQVAAKAGARTFAMTKGSGGRCRELAEICLVVPGTSRFPGQTGKNDNNFHFEDAMLSVNHMLVGLLKQRVAHHG